MKCFVLVLGLVVSAALFVQAQDVASAPSAAMSERVVVVPEDTTPFTVDKGDFVRLTGKGIAGAKIKAKIDGPAKIVAESRLVGRRNGKALVGPGNVDFEIKTTGKGKVTAIITMTPPQPGAEKTVTKYEFEVK
ncbi:MAG: hypothetical protein NTW96_16810 [Planctomycetia bacterium]|nr:hypothetical protein [Planctomycetia bacterium]